MPGGASAGGGLGVGAVRGRATTQHLQVLQAPRPLEVPPVFLGAADVPDPPPGELLAGVEGAGEEKLREVTRKADFWISLLEGERCELGEEIARQKARHQLALRQADAKATELKEAEGEKKRLLSEVQWLQQSRDQAICERHMLRQDKTKMTEQTKTTTETAESREKHMEAELRQAREEKAELETQLVRAKVRAAETLQKVDSMEYLIEFYEDQLRALNPNFEPADLATIGQWMKPSRQDEDADSTCSERKESTAHEEKHKAKDIAKGISKMFKGGFSKLNKKKHKDLDDSTMAPQDSLATPRDPKATPRDASARATPRDVGPAPSPREPGLLAPAPSPPATTAAAARSGVGDASPAVLADLPASSLQDGTSSPASAAGGASGATSAVSSPARPGRRRWEMRQED